MLVKQRSVFNSELRCGVLGIWYFYGIHKNFFMVLNDTSGGHQELVLDECGCHVFGTWCHRGTSPYERHWPFTGPGPTVKIGHKSESRAELRSCFKEPPLPQLSLLRQKTDISARRPTDGQVSRWVSFRQTRARGNGIRQSSLEALLQWFQVRMGRNGKGGGCLF